MFFQSSIMALDLEEPTVISASTHSAANYTSSAEDHGLKTQTEPRYLHQKQRRDM